MPALKKKPSRSGGRFFWVPPESPGATGTPLGEPCRAANYWGMRQPLGWTATAAGPVTKKRPRCSRRLRAWRRAQRQSGAVRRAQSCHCRNERPGTRVRSARREIDCSLARRQLLVLAGSPRPVQCRPFQEARLSTAYGSSTNGCARPEGGGRYTPPRTRSE